VSSRLACRTLFDRLLEGGMHAHLLRVQYRMHAAICDFPNRWFYGGRLLTGVALGAMHAAE
jgi:superfamily I DNA and/or RNA helicase